MIELETLRAIAADVHASRPDWNVDEVLRALSRAADNYPELTAAQLGTDALRIAADPAQLTPWTLTGIGGVYSRHVGRPVERPRMIGTPQAPPVRDVIEPDPYRGDETARAQSYARGAARAREALELAGVDRATLAAEKERLEAAERAERAAVRRRLDELSTTRAEAVDW